MTVKREGEAAMNPADELRSAAELLRKVAENATALYSPQGSGPWAIDSENPELVVDALDCSIAEAATEGTAHWIALMSPAVVEPLADWLETVSNNVRFEATVNGGRACLSVDQESALTFARAITKEAGR